MGPPLPRRSIQFFRRRHTRVQDAPSAPWWPVWVWLGALVVVTVFLVHPVNEHLPQAVLASARWLGRDVVVTLYFALAGFAFLVYYWPRRGENRPFSLSAGAVGAMLGSVLGLGTYVSCLPTDTPWWSSAYHTMALFVGSVHEPFGAVGSTCPTMPVSLEVARILALGVALGALVAVLMRLFVEQVDRLRVRFAHRIVLVTGLSQDTEDFVLRLRQLYDGGARSEDLRDHPDSMMQELAKRWLQGERRPAADVVVVEPNRGHPSVPRLRQAGVRVITADPVTFDDLGRPRLDRCLLAAYLLDEDSTRNVEGANRLMTRIGNKSAKGDKVPVKILVRVDNARDAEAFRRAAMSASTRSVTLDTFGAQQVTCQQIATLAEHSMPDIIVLAGSTPLATTLLDELAQAARERVASGARVQDVPVVVVGHGAASLVADHAYRQRWYGNNPLEVTAVAKQVTETDVVAAVEQRQDDEPVERPFVVDCRGSGEGELLAHRCLQRWPMGSALHQDPSANGVESDSGVLGLHRFSPGLLRGGDVPEDRWTRAARIMHQLYLADWGIDTESAGSQPWEVLSDFYRLSNLRALTHAMHLAGELDRPRVWRPLADSQRPVGLNDDEYAKSARAEHREWMDYYESGGWTPGPKKDESLKQHPLLVAWDDGDPGPIQAKIAKRSEANVKAAFILLEALGYRPYLDESSAEQLSLAEQRPSRWMSEPSCEEDGHPAEMVTARPARPGEWVRSATWSAKAKTKQWVVRDNSGDERLIDQQQFRSLYRPVPLSMRPPAQEDGT